MLNWSDFCEVIGDIQYKDWGLEIEFIRQDMFTMRWTFVEDDEIQYCRTWIVDAKQPKSDIVRTAIFAAITAEEHEVREKFKYKGKKIFNPHFDVDRLAEISGKLANLDIPDAPVAQ